MHMEGEGKEASSLAAGQAVLSMAKVREVAEEGVAGLFIYFLKELSISVLHIFN